MPLCGWRQVPTVPVAGTRAGPSFKEGHGAVSQAWKDSHCNPAGSATVNCRSARPQTWPRRLSLGRLNAHMLLRTGLGHSARPIRMAQHQQTAGRGWEQQNRPE